MPQEFENRPESLFSWQRPRTTEELGDFVARRLAALESVALVEE